MATILKKKPKIAIFDLTDCEGCELEFINLKEKLTKVVGQTEIANWRLTSNTKDLGPFDFTFIEGSVISESDVEAVKQARAASKIVITLGSCAELGGVQALLNKKEWEAGIKHVYGQGYKTKSRSPQPVSYYIEVDYHLPGCPINTEQLENFLASLLLLKQPAGANYPVCLECKGKENSCLLLEGQPCLGPITQGGCAAVCPSRGLRCWGCFGVLAGGNVRALKSFFESNYGKDRTKQLLKIFYSQQNQFKELYLDQPDLPKKKEVKLRLK